MTMQTIIYKDFPIQCGPGDKITVVGRQVPSVEAAKRWIRDVKKNRIASVATTCWIHWYRVGKSRHVIQYGLQVKLFDTQLAAAEEFGYCLRHGLECEGKLD